MALYVDSAFLDDITNVARTVPLAGVTTNPTILLSLLQSFATFRGGCSRTHLANGRIAVQRPPVHTHPGRQHQIPTRPHCTLLLLASSP